MKLLPGARSRSTTLSASLVRQLNSYALAASAAGVSVLALAGPSDAEIVYTPAKTLIGVNQTVGLDLNHDGIVDFSVTNRTESYFFEHHDVLSVSPPPGGNTIWSHTSGVGDRLASALPAGFKIGHDGQFYSDLPKLMASTGTSGGGIPGNGVPFCIAGPWGGVKDRYLGLKFVIKGQFHYGWARLTVGCQDLKVIAVLTGYAYETVPNRPIITGLTHYSENPAEGDTDNSGIVEPQSGTLGHLAQGSARRADE